MTAYERFIEFLQKSGINYEVEENPFAHSDPHIRYSVAIDNELVSPYGCICCWDFDENGNLIGIESE